MPAGRPSSYSDEQKGQAYTMLVANDWNILRTSRDLDIPHQTIRNWSKKWQAGDSKPSASSVDTAVSDFLSNATTLRDKLVISLKQDLEEGRLKPQQKIVAMGVLDDKIARAQGLLRRSDTNINIQLPSAEILLEGLANLLTTSQRSVVERHYEIIDAEIVEQPKGLPKGT